MTTPGDESRTELAWREIVENYGDRPVLDDESRSASAAATAPASGATGDLPEDLPEDLPDEDEVEARERRIAESERFRPPPAPPLPRPRSWQRAVAWAGVFVPPVVALVVGLMSLYVTQLVAWALVVWFVGGFGYLVRQMPRSPRDPWDDGSRV